MITSFKPIVDKNCRILILGTMPSGFLYKGVFKLHFS